jgi:CBS domain containing-hemolysin-like protein
MDYPLIIGIAITLFFSFFFACFEVAYMGSNKAQLIQPAARSLSTTVLQQLYRKPYWLVGSTRVGYCTSLVFFGYFMAQLLLPGNSVLPRSFDNTILTIVVQVLISAILILLIAQFLPKILGNIYPERMLRVSAPLFAFVCTILFPVTYVVLTFSRLIVEKLFHQKMNMKQPLFGITDLNQYFKNIYNVKKDNVNLELDKKILQNALEFKTVKIRECMIPRNEITAIEVTEGLPKLQRVFVESGHSKIIVYRNTIDDIIGYCHSSALFTMPAAIEDIITPVITVHETSLASDLMRTFITERKSLAVVMDEFGGTSGIVSREDVIEEIFGEIEDEFDRDEMVEELVDGSTYLFSARLEIDYLNEAYQFELPIGEYETLGGLILDYTEDFPRQGDTISIGQYTFTILATHHNRIETVRMALTKVA